MEQFPRDIFGAKVRGNIEWLVRKTQFESAEKSEATMERSVALASYVSKIEFSGSGELASIDE